MYLNTFVLCLCSPVGILAMISKVLKLQISVDSATQYFY